MPATNFTFLGVVAPSGGGAQGDFFDPLNWDTTDHTAQGTPVMPSPDTPANGSLTICDEVNMPTTGNWYFNGITCLNFYAMMHFNSGSATYHCSVDGANDIGDGLHFTGNVDCYWIGASRVDGNLVCSAYQAGGFIAGASVGGTAYVSMGSTASADIAGAFTSDVGSVLNTRVGGAATISALAGNIVLTNLCVLGLATLVLAPYKATVSRCRWVGGLSIDGTTLDVQTYCGLPVNHIGGALTL